MEKRGKMSLNDKDMFYVFRKYLVQAIGEGKISFNNNYVHIKNGKNDYVMLDENFLSSFSSDFEYVYEEQLSKFLSVNGFVEEAINLIYSWTNPVLKEIGVNSMVEFLEKFKKKLKENPDYYEQVRKVASEDILILNDDLRKKYIERFIEYGAFKEEDKVELEYYVDYPIPEIQKLVSDGKITSKDAQKIFIQIFAREREKGQKNKNKKVSPRIASALSLIRKHDVINLYVYDGILKEEFLRAKLTKKEILEIDYLSLINFLDSKNEEMPDSLKITSKDLINQYGRTLSGDRIFKLANYGYIKPEDFIDAYEINKALRYSDYDIDKMLTNEEIIAFYNTQTLLEMKNNDTLSPKFTEEYIELNDFENDKEKFKEKSEILVSELKTLERNVDKKVEEEKFQRNVLYFFNIGFCDLETAKANITEQFIEDMYTRDEITIEGVLELYQKGIIDDSVIRKYYNDKELLELYEKGKIKGSCLRGIKDSNFLLEKYCDKKIQTQDFFELYLKSDNLSVNDLNDAFELDDREVDISSFIDEEVPFEKIKELFSNLLIDYASIIRLKNQGMINEEQFSEIKNALNTREIFKEIRDRKKFKVVTTREGQYTPKSKVGIVKEKTNEDFTSEIELISKILQQKNVETEPYSLIESYNSKGYPTSLNNYRVFGNQNLDGIVILQKSQRENAVFVMSALQLMYFLKGKENEDGEIEIKDRMRDKSYLKTIEGVEVVEHSRHFARNLVDASSRVSQKVAETVRPEDKKYQEDVEKMISSMREQYDLNKASKDRND